MLLLAGANPLIKIYDAQTLTEKLNAYNENSHKHNYHLCISEKIKQLASCLGKTCFEVRPEILQDPDIQEALIERERLKQQQSTAQQTQSVEMQNLAAYQETLTVKTHEKKKKKNQGCVIS